MAQTTPTRRAYDMLCLHVWLSGWLCPAVQGHRGPRQWSARILSDFLPCASVSLPFMQALYGTQSEKLASSHPAWSHEVSIHSAFGLRSQPLPPIYPT